MGCVLGVPLNRIPCLRSPQGSKKGVQQLKFANQLLYQFKTLAKQLKQSRKIFPQVCNKTFSLEGGPL